VYITLPKINGVPVFCHWTVVFVMAVVSFLNDFKPAESLLACMAYIVLILIHELGHLFFLQRAGLQVFAISISGMGGACYSTVPAAKADALLVYSGGVIFQFILFFLSLGLVSFLEEPIHFLLSPILIIFIHFNLFLILTNLFPGELPGGLQTDGKQIYNILRGNYAGDA